MRIIQMLRNLSYGDAIGNDTFALKSAISKMGYKAEIYAEFIDSRLPKNTAKQINRIAQIEDDDVVIYHLSTGTDLNYKFANLNCKKIVRYHNITPPEFFRGYNSEAEKSCEEGLEAAKAIADKVDYCLAVSQFNKDDLIKMGYRQKIDVLPILIPFSDYDKPADPEIIKEFSDGNTNIVFTGRVAPNKKHEDIIRIFYYYKNYIDKKARLFLVGGYAETDRYYQKLAAYVEELRLKDVYFTGHIKFNQILAYYKVADIFVCMSEHEGFCVPLAEAMYFKKPILAYSCTAIPDTLGDGGVLMQEKDPKLASLLIERILHDENLKQQILSGQEKRLKAFAYDEIYGQFKTYLTDFLEGRK